ncbi:tolloid-like protein 1 isoform X2 [Exaiptasia diaphana]|uniref:CUB domain-containing protein n=1 Tax=Exaiptasia diaphana TaxID=2652724 RepID=A0A913XVZ5_EXADI|nr:tolloid-like protein 1 isoform X2 [Exaiptasia diaphana]XP_020910690.1 tolloid-like protein 1 isoform X2 [Exaiptasia diaphana]
MELWKARLVTSFYVLLLLMIIGGSSASQQVNVTHYSSAECYKVINSSLEYLYSPDYPNAAPFSSKCTWELHATPGKYVAIQTIDMNVGGTDWDCTLGYLEIFDGCGDNKFLVDKICFSRYQNGQRYLWVSTGTCVTVQFNSAAGKKNKFNLVARHTSSSCNAVFHGSPNGTFSRSVSLPSEKKECTWVVAVPRNKVELKFPKDFHITGNSLACKDNLLTVQDGKFSSSKVIGTFCGHTRPYPVYSTLNSMRITFKSNGNLGDANTFTAQYTMIQKEPAIRTNYCNSEIMMSDHHGKFFSPLYPFQYPAFLKCVWLIQVKQDLKILLRFKDFDVEGDTEKCQDYVEIYDGLASWSPIKGRYCGGHIPPVFKSETNKLRVIFTTDSRKYAGRGFEAVYSEYNQQKDQPSSSRSHFTGIMIGTTCGIIFIVLSVLAVFHARKRRLRRALEQQVVMGSTISFDVNLDPPPTYVAVMNSPNLFPQTKVEHNRASTCESLPKVNDEELGLLESNQDSDEDGPPPPYEQVRFVHGYRPIHGQFTVEYHRNTAPGDQAGSSSPTEKSESERRAGRVWQRMRDLDQSHSSISRSEPSGLPKDEASRPMLERQDTCSSFVTDV